MTGIGIDFGTTNSTVVSYDKKNNRMDFFLERGHDNNPVPVPSVVWYHDNIVTVGKEAKNKYNTFSGRAGHCLIRSVKSQLGTNNRLSVFGDLKEPYEIAGDIIEHMKKEAINRFHADKIVGKFDQAVFTVPINFDGRQRSDLRKAANRAGINVNAFIHEPFAAVVGFLFAGSNPKGLKTYNGKYILVFDWGGGTLDITVVKAENNKLFEMGTSQLSGVAGDKFDDELKTLCVNRFIDQHAAKFKREYLEEKLREKEDTLVYYAEKSKIELSNQSQTNFNVDSIFAAENGSERVYYDINETISKEEFEACIKSDVDRAINKIHEALKSAHISADQISLALLTGGSSHIPLVVDEIRKIFGHRVVQVPNSDTIIAEGAAIVAANNWVPFLAKNIMVELSDKSHWVVYDKGTELIPDTTYKEETFICVDNRDAEGKLILAEGYKQDRKDRNLGVLNIPLLSKKPYAAFFDTIATTYEIDRDYVLNVSGYSEFEKRRKKLNIYDLCIGLEVSGEN